MSSQRNPQSCFCACGCDCQPVRGEFCPGHDAKLRGKYLCRIDDGEVEAISEFLDDWPKLSRSYGYTEASLRARFGQGCKPPRR